MALWSLHEAMSTTMLLSAQRRAQMLPYDLDSILLTQRVLDTAIGTFEAASCRWAWDVAMRESSTRSKAPYSHKTVAIIIVEISCIGTFSMISC